MKVLQEDDNKRGRFFIELDGIPQAKMTYTWAGQHKIIIDHTEVSDIMRGKGSGKQMVLKAVEFAREHHLKIIPLCPFAKSIFEKIVEIRDVI